MNHGVAVALAHQKAQSEGVAWAAQQELAGNMKMLQEYLGV